MGFLILVPIGWLYSINRRSTSSGLRYHRLNEDSIKMMNQLAPYFYLFIFLLIACYFTYYYYKLLYPYSRDLKEGSKEITTWITAENEIIASIRGISQQLPSIENIQAIEDCELIGGSFEQLEFLYENYPEMNIVSRKLLTQYYADAEERAYISRLTKANSRYKHFISTKGQLVNRIPLRYIASYLGMTLETLSRTRSKMR